MCKAVGIGNTEEIRGLGGREGGRSLGDAGNRKASFFPPLYIKLWGSEVHIKRTLLYRKSDNINFLKSFYQVLYLIDHLSLVNSVCQFEERSFVILLQSQEMLCDKKWQLYISASLVYFYWQLKLHFVIRLSCDQRDYFKNYICILVH